LFFRINLYIERANQKIAKTKKRVTKTKKTNTKEKKKRVNKYINEKRTSRLEKLIHHT
jgi:hypothetical protein